MKDTRLLTKELEDSKEGISELKMLLPRLESSTDNLQMEMI